MSPITEQGVFLGKIAYAKYGNAPRPLLVFQGGQAFMRRPGPGRAEKDARRMARLLPAGASFVLLGYDQAPPPDYSIDGIAEDFAEIIGAHWSASPIVAVSFGGLVATQLAARHPDRVETLTLVATAHRFSDQGRERIARQIACAERGDFAGLAASFATVFRRPWLNAMVAASLWLGRKTLSSRMNDPRTIIRSLQAAIAEAPDADAAWLREVRAPTLIIGGERDQFFGEGTMQAAANLIPDARLRILPGETHMAPAERSRDVARLLEPWLRRDTSPP